MKHRCTWPTKVPKKEGYYWVHHYVPKHREWVTRPALVSWLKSGIYFVTVMRSGDYCTHNAQRFGKVYFGPAIRSPKVPGVIR